jgi:hypothetical protein
LTLSFGENLLDDLPSLLIFPVDAHARIRRPHCFEHGRQRKRQRLRWSARRVDPVVLIDGGEVLASLGPPATAAGARSTTTRSTFWRCNVVVDVGPRRASAAADRRRIEELESTTSAACRRSASGGECMLFRAWDGETRPASVGELRPHFPDSPGGPRWIWAPRPLTSRTSRDNREMPNRLQPPPYVNAKRAEKLVALWPPRTAS